MFDFILFAGEGDGRLVLTVWLDGEVAACGLRLGLAVWRRAVLRYSDENITEKTLMCFAWFKFNELQKNAKKYLAK